MARKRPLSHRVVKSINRFFDNFDVIPGVKKLEDRYRSDYKTPKADYDLNKAIKGIRARKKYK